MSTSPDVEEEIQFFSSVITASLIEMATMTLVAYEYLVTLDNEVTLFWKRKITGATLLFLGTRYLALLSWPILGAITFASMSDKSCTVLGYFQFVPSVAQDLVWAAFSALRALALSGMNWPLASVVFVLAACPFGVNMWNMSLGLPGMSLQRLGCADGNNLTPHEAVMAVAISRSCVIAADILVIAVTWQSRLTRDRTIPGVGAVSSLGSILITNGTIYFLVIVILNALHLTLTCLSIVDAVDGFSEVTTFTDPFTAILTWRFLLALQSAEQRAVGEESIGGARSAGQEDHDAAGSLVFASRVIGSAGASLSIGHGTSFFDEELVEEENSDENHRDEMHCESV